MLFLFFVPAAISFLLIPMTDGSGAFEGNQVPFFFSMDASLRQILLFSIVLIDLTLVGGALVDLMRLVPASAFSGTRTVQRIASQGKRQKVSENRGVLPPQAASLNQPAMAACKPWLAPQAGPGE